MIDAEKFLGRSDSDDAASFEKNDTRGEQQSLAEVVSDENDGFAKAMRQGAEFALQLGAGDGIERAEGLIHKKDGWIGGESACDSHALALAAGEFAGVAVSKFSGVQSDEGQEFADANGGAATVPFFERGDQGDVFGNRKMGEETGVLNDVPDAAAELDGVPLRGGAILDKNLAFGGK